MRRQRPTSLLPALLVATLAAFVGARWIAGVGNRGDGTDGPPGPANGAQPLAPPRPPSTPVAVMSGPGTSGAAASAAESRGPSPVPPAPRAAGDEPRPAGGDLAWIDSLGVGLRRAAEEGRLCLVYLQRPPDT